MMPRLYDAHMHLQEPELSGLLDEIRTRWTALGLVAAVVNGTSEADWAAVRALGMRDPRVFPSLGLHPWFIRDRTSDWLGRLERILDDGPSVIGEIGIDHHVRDRDDRDQEAVFLAQLELARRRDLPVTIHCVQAWGRLDALLRAHRDCIPTPGFLLHAYGGSAEMVAGFADLGAWFSLSGRVGDKRAERLGKALRAIPPDRLLIETDAPALPPPPDWTEVELKDPKTGRRLSHPANIIAGYRCVADRLDTPLEDLADRVEQNFIRLFGVWPVQDRAGK